MYEHRIKIHLRLADVGYTFCHFELVGKAPKLCFFRKPGTRDSEQRILAMEMIKLSSFIPTCKLTPTNTQAPFGLNAVWPGNQPLLVYLEEYLYSILRHVKSGPKPD
jgi:hypothetical protein